MTQRLDHQALSPAGMRSIRGVYQYLTTCGLPPSLLNLVYLRASQLNGCAYCISAHSADLLRAGVAAQKLLLLPAWREARTSFAPEERAALQWTEAVTLIADSHAPDADFEEISAHFTPKQVVDLTTAIGLINVYNRLSIAMRKPPVESKGQ